MKFSMTSLCMHTLYIYMYYNNIDVPVFHILTPDFISAGIAHDCQGSDSTPCAWIRSGN